MPKQLDTEIRTLLADSRGDWQAIADCSDVSHSWISKFVNGHIPNPGYATLMKLRSYFKTKPRGRPTAMKAAEPARAEG